MNLTTTQFYIVFVPAALATSALALGIISSILREAPEILRSLYFSYKNSKRRRRTKSFLSLLTLYMASYEAGSLDSQNSKDVLETLYHTFKNSPYFSQDVGRENFAGMVKKQKEQHK